MKTARPGAAPAGTNWHTGLALARMAREHTHCTRYSVMGVL
jgi:hypothetical protein